MIEAYITNLGLYNANCLDGEFLKFPAKTEDFQNLLKRIHVDGVRYEEIFIATYNSDISGLCKNLGEYENIDELNYFATLLDDLEESDMQKFAAALTLGNHTNSLKELINLTQNLDNYDLYPDIKNEEDLGFYYIDNINDVPEHLRDYFDYEAYGRDIYLNDESCFTDIGYISYISGDFVEYYTGLEDIPEDCKIFAYPKPEKSIRAALDSYKQIANDTPTVSTDRLKHSHNEH